MRKLITLVLGIMILGSSLGYADSADDAVQITEKLGRGIGNVLSSPLEIPCGFRDEIAERGASGIVSGLFRGLTLFFRRVLVGVTEIGTFIIPMGATIPRVCAEKPKPAVS